MVCNHTSDNKIGRPRILLLRQLVNKSHHSDFKMDLIKTVLKFRIGK